MTVAERAGSVANQAVVLLATLLAIGTEILRIATKNGVKVTLSTAEAFGKVAVSLTEALDDTLDEFIEKKA